MQQSALSSLLRAAERHQVRISLRTGDILYFNNWALLHRRDSYQDNDATSRHLVRLWLRNSQLGWKVPSSLSVPWDAAFKNNGKVEQVYALEPIPEYKVPKYTAGSAAFLIEDSDEDVQQDQD
jgi:hypothetical protein